jgi:hypothetical protein
MPQAQLYSRFFIVAYYVRYYKATGVDYYNISIGYSAQQFNIS